MKIHRRKIEIINTNYCFGVRFSSLNHLSCYMGHNDLMPRVLYEGWNFNIGNYLFTTDTK